MLEFILRHGYERIPSYSLNFGITLSVFPYFHIGNNQI
eukprot:UN17297